MVGHANLALHQIARKEGAKTHAQPGHILGPPRRHDERLGPTLGKRARRRRFGRRITNAIDLVEDDEAGNVGGPDVRQDLGGDVELARKPWIRGVHDVRQQAGLQGLVERALERCDQAVRQLVDETDRVGHQDAWMRFGRERAHRGVERGKQFVGDVHLAAGQPAHQRRLARVGVAHQGDSTHVAAPRPLRVLLGCQRRQLAGQLGDAIANLPPVQLYAGFAGSLTADSAALSILARAHFAQTRRHILQAHDLDLGLGHARTGVPAKDLQDHGRPIHDLGARGLFQIARLRRTDVVIDQHDLDRRCRGGKVPGRPGHAGLLVIGPAQGRCFGRLALLVVVAQRCVTTAGQRREFLELAFADHGAGVKRMSPLRDGGNHGQSQRARQPIQFSDRRAERSVVDSVQLHGNQHRPRRA